MCYFNKFSHNFIESGSFSRDQLPAPLILCSPDEFQQLTTLGYVLFQTEFVFIELVAALQERMVIYSISSDVVVNLEMDNKQKH
jgi:hypothetical protein